MAFTKRSRNVIGQGAVEYALILAFVVAILVIGFKMGFFSEASQKVQDHVNSGMDTAMT